jgi:hypothetical protein
VPRAWRRPGGALTGARAAGVRRDRRLAHRPRAVCEAARRRTRRHARSRHPASVGRPRQRAVAAGPRLVLGPRPHRRLQAPVAGQQLIEPEQVDAAAQHGRGRLRGQALVALGLPRVGRGAVEPRAVLEVPDQAGGVVLAREVRPTLREVLVADRARLSVRRPGEDRARARPAHALGAGRHDDHLSARGEDLVARQRVGQLGARAPLRRVQPPAELLAQDLAGGLAARACIEVVLDVQQQHLARVPIEPADDRGQHVGERRLDRAALVLLLGVADDGTPRAAGRRAREPVDVELEAADAEPQLVDERQLLVGVGVREGVAHLGDRVERVVRADPRRVDHPDVAGQRELEVERAARRGLLERPDVRLVARGRGGRLGVADEDVRAVARRDQRLGRLAALVGERPVGGGMRRGGDDGERGGGEEGDPGAHAHHNVLSRRNLRSAR